MPKNKFLARTGLRGFVTLKKQPDLKGVLRTTAQRLRIRRSSSYCGLGEKWCGAQRNAGSWGAHFNSPSGLLKNGRSSVPEGPDDRSLAIYCPGTTGNEIRPVRVRCDSVPDILELGRCLST
jgi:hypothetical protein